MVDAEHDLRTSSERAGTEAAEAGKQVGHAHWLQDERVSCWGTPLPALFRELGCIGLVPLRGGERGGRQTCCW